MSGPTEPFAALIVPIPRQDGPGEPPPGFEGIWGGGNVPMPNPPIANVPGAPGYKPPQPGQPHPEHPIVLPPDAPPPVIIWGPPDGRPTPPIALPGLPGWEPGQPLPPDAPKFDWHVGWSEEHGWVVWGTPNFPHPAPSKKK